MEGNYNLGTYWGLSDFEETSNEGYFTSLQNNSQQNYEATANLANNQAYNTPLTVDYLQQQFQSCQPMMANNGINNGVQAYAAPANYTQPSNQVIETKIHKETHTIIIYDRENKAMYCCNAKTTAKGNDVIIAPYGFPQAMFAPNSITKIDNCSKISTGCAEFVKKINRSNISGEEVAYCVIHISSSIEDRKIEVLCKDITGKSKSLKTTLSNYGICFTATKGFNLWCYDISTKMQSCSVTERVLPEFSQENGKWKINRCPTENLSFSEQKSIIAAFEKRLHSNSQNGFAELTLILYSTIARMYHTIKKEEYADIASLIIVNRDINFARKQLKEGLSLSNNDIIVSTDVSPKEMASLSEKPMPIITIEGTKYKVNSVISRYGSISDMVCLPIFVIGKLDDICQNERLIDFLVLYCECEFEDDLKSIIDIFLSEIFGENYLFDIIKEKIVEFRESDNNIDSYKKNNLISLLIALSQAVLPRIGMANTEDFTNRYLDYLNQGGADTLLDLSKLKNILKADVDFTRVPKSTACKLEDNFLYIGDDVVSVNSSTMTNIANKFGFASTHSFVVRLNECGCLKTSGNTYMDVINVNGTTTRGYSFKLSSLFSFGEFRPCNGINCEKPIYSIPLGKTSTAETVSFPIFKNGNNSLFISGQPGCGKTNLCNYMATEASKAGLSVLIIGMRSSIEDLAATVNPIVVTDEENPIPWGTFTNGITKVVTLGNDSKLLDSVLERFFNHKKLQTPPVPTLLILDEIQDFTWDGDTIIKNLLRQGRKHNIYPVLSTQYLDSDNGTNIEDILKQVNTFCCFKNGKYPKNKSKKYPQIQNCVEELDWYEALVFDEIEVNGTTVKLPIKLKTAKSQ